MKLISTESNREANVLIVKMPRVTREINKLLKYNVRISKSAN